ncbi:MAG: transposase [Pelovirga sp.]
MSRKPRIHYPGAIYRVILRGNARQAIFFDEADRCRFSLLGQEGTARSGHRVVALCQLTNHVHLAIQVGDAPLSRIIQNPSFPHTRWINWQQQRCGHLFQGRYKAVLVDADSHLLELTAYIHLNLVRAGVVDKPQNYPWSSQCSRRVQGFLHPVVGDIPHY